MPALVGANLVLCALAIYCLSYIGGLQDRINDIEVSIETPRLSGEYITVMDPKTGRSLTCPRYVGDTYDEWRVRLEDAERKMLR